MKKQADDSRFWFVFPLFALIITAAAVIIYRNYGEVLASSTAFREWLLSRKEYYPLIFVLVQFFQVVIFIIPGEIPQFAGGFVFGVLKGTLLSMAGIAAGSMTSFYISRIFGVPFAVKILPPKTLFRFKKILRSDKAVAGFFMFFLFPGIPKDILCYIAGLSQLRGISFLLISMVGRFPALLLSNIMGNAAKEQNWLILVLTIVLGLIFALTGYLKRASIHKAIEKFAFKKDASGGSEES